MANELPVVGLGVDEILFDPSHTLANSSDIFLTGNGGADAKANDFATRTSAQAHVNILDDDTATTCDASAAKRSEQDRSLARSAKRFDSKVDDAKELWNAKCGPQQRIYHTENQVAPTNTETYQPRSEVNDPKQQILHDRAKRGVTESSFIPSARETTEVHKNVISDYARLMDEHKKLKRQSEDDRKTLNSRIADLDSQCKNHASARRSAESEVRVQQQQIRELQAKLKREAARSDRAEQGVEEVKNFVDGYKKLTGEVNRLKTQCNMLVKQTGVRRGPEPIEDESHVCDDFRALRTAVKDWCIYAWEAKPEDAGVQFTNFPLSAKSDVPYTTSENWLLMASVWEWLMKDVFSCQYLDDPGRIFDLWLDKYLAKSLRALENHVEKSQKTEVFREWRSFTIQCLNAGSTKEDLQRTDDLVSDFRSWLLPLLLSHSHGNTTSWHAEYSEKFPQLMRRFETDILKPAIKFSYILRKRYNPMQLYLPFTIEMAISQWREKLASANKETQQKAELRVIWSPELRRCDTTSTGDSRLQTLYEAQTWPIVDEKDYIADEIHDSRSSKDMSELPETKNIDSESEMDDEADFKNAKESFSPPSSPLIRSIESLQVATSPERAAGKTSTTKMQRKTGYVVTGGLRRMVPWK